MPRRTVGLTLFGMFFILLGLCYLLIPLNFYKIIQPISSSETLTFSKYFAYVVTPGIFLNSLLYIVIGVGIFQLRSWAWYLIIADLIIKTIGLPNNGFIFGWQALNWSTVSIKIGLIVFVLWFFMRRGIREQFALAQNKFKLKSWYAAVAILFLGMTLVVPLSSLGYKIFILKTNQKPFLVQVPPVIKLADVNVSRTKHNFTRREILDFSLLIPNDFRLQLVNNNELGVLGLGDGVSAPDNNLILVEDKNVLALIQPMYELLNLENAYQFEKAVYSNNWGIILLVLRDMLLPNYGDQGQIRQFSGPEIKGFIKFGCRTKSDLCVYECSVYDKNGKDMGNVMLFLNRKHFSDEDVFKIIASIRSSPPKEAAEFFKAGKECYAKGDLPGAQIAFANAYYYMPDKVEYGYMLAETLDADNTLNLMTARRILNEVLKKEPDYVAAEELLKKLPKMTAPRTAP